MRIEITSSEGVKFTLNLDKVMFHFPGENNVGTCFAMIAGNNVFCQESYEDISNHLVLMNQVINKRIV